MTETSAERLCRMASERGDFVKGDDGYYVYWPSNKYGALSAWMLRVIADELDKMNAEWDKTVQNYFEAPSHE